MFHDSSTKAGQSKNIITKLHTARYLLEAEFYITTNLLAVMKVFNIYIYTTFDLGISFLF